MPPGKRKSALHASAADTTKAVDEFMSELDHPFKVEVQAIRETVLGVDSRITEGVKWNAPSFRTTEYFATINLRERAGVGIILHMGAKIRDTGPEGIPISHLKGLLRRLAKDRAMVVFKDMGDFTAKRAAFEGLVRQWIIHV